MSVESNGQVFREFINRLFQVPTIFENYVTDCRVSGFEVPD